MNRSSWIRCWPTPSGMPPWHIMAGLAAIAGALYLTAGLVEIDPGRVFRSVGRMAAFLAHFAVWPDWSYVPRLALKLLETLEMALIGTTVAVVISLPLGFLAARNATVHGLVFFVTRSLLSFVRAVPEMIWALVLVSAVGLGPLPGVLAMSVVTVGFLAKFFAESIEVADRRALEGVAAHGARGLQLRTFGILPQVAPDFVGIVLYILDHNVRAAAILGLVGAGGIGFDMVMAMRLFRFDRLILIIFGIYLAVTCLDRLSHAVRSRVI